MGGAHQGTEVKNAVQGKFCRFVVEAASLAAVVNNDEHLRVFAEFGEQVGIALLPNMLHGGAAQLREEGFWFRRDFAHVFKAAIEAVFGLHSWLGGGAHDDAAAVVLRQFFDGLHDRQQQIERQHLRFVEDDDRACNVVQLAAARGAISKEGFEELHGGGHDNRRVPVFRGKAQFVFGGFVLQFAVVESAVVFQHGLFAQLTKALRNSAAFCSMMLVNGMT